jgi:hypothetical protein
MKNRHSKTIILILGFGFFSFCVLGLASWYFVKDNPIYKYKVEGAIQKARNWALLAPLPVQEKDIKIKAKGAMKNQQFTISFEAEAKTIENWLRKSAGPARAKKIIQETGNTIYKIKPGKGASFAELRLSKDKTQVQIEVHWKETKR